MTRTGITKADRATETGISRARARCLGGSARGVVLTALLAAGCGASSHRAGQGLVGSPSGAPGAGPGPRAVIAAARRTLQLSAKVGWRLEGSQVFGPAHAPVFGNGPFDLATGRGTETIDLPEITHQEPGTEHATFLPSQVYLQPRAGTFAVLPRGRRWLSASLIGSESVRVNFPQFVAQVEGVNPGLLLSEIEWGATASRPLGPGRQIVDHVAAERYRVSVSLTRALARASGPEAPAFSQAIQEQLLGSGVTAFDVLTWLDGPGRVVQMQTRLPGTGEGTALVALSYFGSPVRVVPPPQSEVIDITSLTPSGERENNGGGDTDGG